MGNNLATPARPLQSQDPTNEDEPPPPLPPQQLPLSPLPQPPPQLPQENQPSTCEICIEPIISPTQLFKSPNNDKCGPHPFCKDCMIRYIQAKLDDNVSKIACPALNCSQFLDPQACRTLVGPQLFVKWCDSLCESAVMGFPRSFCPNRNCSALIVNECGGTVKKATCPCCKRLFCFQCKLPWHAGFRCEESGEFRDRNDRAFGVLVEQKNWMRCPQCQHFVELIEGCQIVKCRCLASFCYKCGRQVYQHWCTCDSTSMCCVWFLRIFTVLIGVFGVLFLFWNTESRKHNV
ncbi:unnamed protein product [Coffea canephora]|uniref:RBR-type E3 ubiquitin transferase n=2 Tax=Coffea TaxID=13442 RepID=A0A068VLU9_COFCA|nr:probable E3 ubiquitin-protein ligase RNF217 isoform X1 [Coffea arabica]CDP20653.1 unnamed protein product [Coffea canephora]